MADKRVFKIEYHSGDAQAPFFLEDFDHEYRAVKLGPIVAGVGYIQATTDSKEDIDDGHADWETWPAGSVSTATSDTVDPSVTAIRVYRTSGDLRLVVRLV